MIKTCNKCFLDKSLDEFSKQKKGKYYFSSCRKCMNETKSNKLKENKKSPLKSTYRNCAIRENNKIYYTSKLSDVEIIELKELGYFFIFKSR